MRRALTCWLPGVAMVIALGSCMFDGPPQARVGPGCMISGCSGEVCSDHSVVSGCIWHEAYACYRTATCARQSDGACDWTPTEELSACLASHSEPVP